MDVFFKIIALALASVIAWLLLSKRDKEFAVALTLVVCAMMGIALTAFLEPVVSFVQRLLRVTQLDTAQLSILMKSVGVTLVSQLASMVCRDAGNETLGKLVELIASATVIWLALPLMQALLELLERMLSFF